MKFNDFFHSDRHLAMVLTINEYESIKSQLKEYYTEKDINRIDDWAKFKWREERFLLCNLIEKEEIITPIMCLNAVTFIDRIPFKNIEF